MIFQEMPEDRARECVAGAQGHGLHDSAVCYPAWYLKRWHFLPEGYLSARSAAGYDAVIRRIYYAASEHRAVHALRRAMAARPPERVLDAGCGSGRTMAALARAFPRARLVGAELSPYLLDLAHRRLGWLGHRSSLAHADVTALPFEPGSFDAISANHVLGHMPEGPALQAAAELRRVLAPGGRLFVIDHAWHPLRLAGMDLLRTVSLAGGLMRLQVFAEPGSPSQAAG